LSSVCHVKYSKITEERDKSNNIYVVFFRELRPKKT